MLKQVKDSKPKCCHRAGKAGGSGRLLCWNTIRLGLVAKLQFFVPWSADVALLLPAKGPQRDPETREHSAGSFGHTKGSAFPSVRQLVSDRDQLQALRKWQDS